MSATDPLDESADLSPRARNPAYHFYQDKRNNGDGLNRVMWGIAATAVLCLIAINGFLWAKLWDLSQSMARVETRVEMILTRLPP